MITDNRLIRRILLGTVFVVGLLIQRDAQAGTLSETYGFSARGMSIGNAVTATVDDWSSVYYNMAGLGRSPQTTLDGRGGQSQLALSGFYTLPMMHIDINRPEGNDVKGDDNLNFGATVIGVVVDINSIYKLPAWISTGRFGLGLSTIAPNVAARINDLDLRTHNFIRYGRNVQIAKILPAVGFGFLDDTFGVGVGANLAFGGKGANILTNVKLDSETTQTPESQTKLDQTTEAFLTAGMYFDPHRLSSAFKNLKLGATYRQESYLQISPIYNDAHMEVGNLAMPLVISMYGFYTPHTFSFGGAFTHAKTTWNLDLNYEMWSSYRPSPSRVEVHDQLMLEKEASGEDANLYAIPELRDVVIPRVGFVHELTDGVQLLGGYYYQMPVTPTEANTGKMNILDNHKHVFSSGLDMLFDKVGNFQAPLRLTICYQLQLLLEREVEKQEASEWDPNYSYGGWGQTVMLETSIAL